MDNCGHQEFKLTANLDKSTNLWFENRDLLQLDGFSLATLSALRVHIYEVLIYILSVPQAAGT